MRFDDRISTQMRLPTLDVSAKTSVWAQLVDVIAQHGCVLDVGRRGAIFAHITELGKAVPLERRISVSRAVARVGAHSDAVTLLGSDVPRVAAPLLSVIKLDADDWAEHLPNLPPASRALIRSRRDLPQATSMMLAQFGSSDFALPASDVALDNGAVPPSVTPIQELVERIEAFQRQRAQRLAAAPLVVLESPSTSARRFRFESDRDGLLCWVDGAPRGALIGMSLAELAQPASFGVDGHATGAFRQRMGFTDARLLVPGSGDAGGSWLISADPLFNEEDGRFTGYRGVGRRPDPEEHLNSDMQVATLPEMPADSVRQLSHELRTPLNAISGFAEMIDQQVLGPAAAPYRHRAQAIMADARYVTEIVEDADLSARQGQPSLGDSNTTDIAALLHNMKEAVEAQASRRAIRLDLKLAKGSHISTAGPDICLRAISRFLMSMVSACADQGALEAELSQGPLGTELSVQRPLALAGMGTEALFETDAVSATGMAPGFGFSMRLVDSLSRAAGGRFVIGRDELTLILPRAHSNAAATKGGS